MDVFEEGNNPYFSVLVGLLLVEFTLCFYIPFWIEKENLTVDTALLQNRSDVLSFKDGHILKMSKF